MLTVVPGAADADDPGQYGGASWSLCDDVSRLASQRVSSTVTTPEG
jgi:hypothetical protein